MTKATRRMGVVLTLAASCALVLSSAARAGNIGMVCTPGGPTFNLVANTGYMETPDSNSLFMWSYASQGGDFQTPGPVLCVTEGDTVTIHLHNGLDSHPTAPTMVPENVSIVFPGQEGVDATGGVSGSDSFTKEAIPGGDVTYTFTASKPGTYIYESGTDPAKQIEMGLYGALVVRPAGHPGQVYTDASTAFNPSKEFVVMLADFDPDLHSAVETGDVYDFTKIHNRYFAVNGREFPDSIQDNGVPWLPHQPYGALVRIQPYCNPSTPGDPLNSPACIAGSTPNTLPALIRMINVGTLNHPFHPHGNHLRQIAQDGRPFANDATSEHFGETIGSGQTEDYLLTWADQDFWDATSNPFPNNVATIDYQNLTFKDANTWFSGSAYLGKKGTLPTGVTSQNICGEWYFPWHSHALNEFTNFDLGFGGMATLLRVDPLGGCYASPSSTTILTGGLKTGTYSALAIDDSSYYQVNPKTTTLRAAMTATQTTALVNSATGFPTAGNYYVQIGSEVVQVTGGQGTTTWNVTRHVLGTTQAAHANGTTVTALDARNNDWYAGFTGVPAGSTNFRLTYKGANCATTTASTCTAFAAGAVPAQTVKICNWTVGGAIGCSTPTSAGWTTVPGGPGTQNVGSTDVTSTWTLPGSPAAYIGTGSYKGQVRVLVDNHRTAGVSTVPYSTWGNFMKLVYDAP